MRIKKVLSLAVVLALVLTVVPMFGLTAGAALPEGAADITLDINPNVIVKPEDIKFNGDTSVYPNVTTNGDSADIGETYIGWEGTWGETNDSNNSEPENYGSPSSYRFAGICKATDAKGPYDEAAGQKNYLKFQFNYSTNEQSPFTYGKNSWSKVTTPGYGLGEIDDASNTYLSLEWIFYHNYNSNAKGFTSQGGNRGFYGSFYFYDKSGTQFAQAIMDKNTSGNPTFGATVDTSNGHELQRIVVVNGTDKENPTHTVYYQKDTGSGYVTMATNPDVEGFVTDFGSMKVSRGKWNIGYSVFGLADFKVYAGNYTIADTTVKLQTTNGDKTFGQKVVRGLVGDTIDLTREDVAPEILTDNGTVYVKDSDAGNAESHKISAETREVTVKYKADTISDITSKVDDITVIYGNKPVLPEKVEISLTSGGTATANVSWDWEEKKPTENPKDQTSVTVTGKVDGFDGQTTFTVTVMHYSYSMKDQGSDNGGNKYESFKQTVTKDVYIEFDVKINAEGDFSVQFGKDGGRWGNTTDSGYGVNFDSRLGAEQHRVKATWGDGGDGKVEEVIFENAANVGEVYRVLAKIDAENHSGEVTVVNPIGKAVTKSGTNFRKASLREINSVNVCSDGGVADGIVITNVKVYDPNIAPSQPVATLGYDGGAFTMDIAYGEIAGDSIKVTADSDFEQSKETTEGVTLKTGATNRNYTITAMNGTTAGEALITSIYELVVKAVADEKGEMKADKLAAANKVIAEGGIIDIDSLDDVRSQIMKKIESQDVNGIEIIETIFNKGIGFVVSEGKIYVGSDSETAANVTTSDEGAKGVYRYMKINGQNVILSNDPTFASTDDAVTLSLDSVNIEFVETLIEELEAEGADAAQDFIPEL